MTDFIDTETHAIHNGVFKHLTKSELLAFPWIVEALATPGAKLFVNNCLGYEVHSINEGGAIMGADPTASPLYIARYTADKRPSRIYLLETTRDKDGFVEPDPLNSVLIRKVTVSTNYSKADGPRVFGDGANVYYMSGVKRSRSNTSECV
jgi:hypothetical protein